MNFFRTLAALVILTLAAPLALADGHETKPSMSANRTITFSAEVVAINHETREVTLAGDDSQNIQTHKVILVTINHVKEAFKESTSIHTLSSTREGVGTKQDDQTS